MSLCGPSYAKSTIHVGVGYIQIKHFAFDSTAKWRVKTGRVVCIWPRLSLSPTRVIEGVQGGNYHSEGGEGGLPGRVPPNHTRLSACLPTRLKAEHSTLYIGNHGNHALVNETLVVSHLSYKLWYPTATLYAWLAVAGFYWPRKIKLCFACSCTCKPVFIVYCCELSALTGITRNLASWKYQYCRSRFISRFDLFTLPTQISKYSRKTQVNHNIKQQETFLYLGMSEWGKKITNVCGSYCHRQSIAQH